MKRTCERCCSARLPSRQRSSNRCTAKTSMPRVRCKYARCSTRPGGATISQRRLCEGFPLSLVYPRQPGPSLPPASNSFGIGGSVEANPLFFIEAVRSGVPDAECACAWTLRGSATMSFSPSNEGDIGKSAAAAAGNGFEQKPRNRAGFRRRLAGDRFAAHLAAVVQPPCRAGEVRANRTTLPIEELRVGPHQGPRASRAAIDLDPVALRLQHQPRAGRHIGRQRSLLGRSLLGPEPDSTEEKAEERQNRSFHDGKSIAGASIPASLFN
jgi:hypothetical protein